MRAAISIFAILLVAGCSQSGLSPREGPHDYASYITTLYEKPEMIATPAAPPRFPVKLAIAQIGEMAPSQQVLERLQSERSLFAAVTSIPGMFSDWESHRSDNPAAVRENSRVQIERSPRLARDLGMDYLFVYGGTIDHDTHSNPLAFFDWTIIGAYIVPGKNVAASGKACGALIDLATGRVLLVSNVQDEKHSLSSTAASDGAELHMINTLRAELALRLAHQFVSDCKQRGTALIGG